MPDDLRLEVKKFLSQMTGLDVEEINDDADLIKNLGIDSLKVIEIATHVERTYKVVVKDSQLMTLKTVNDAVKLLEELLAKKNEQQ